MLAALMTPSAIGWLQRNYRGLRDAGSSRWAASSVTLLRLLAWIVFPLEGAAWQRVRAHRDILYPHVTHARPGDPLRLLLQTVWLLVRRPEPRPFRWPAWCLHGTTRRLNISIGKH